MDRIENIEINQISYDIGKEPQTSTKDIINREIDFALVDEEDNPLLVLKNGHIETKKFNSKTISASSSDRVFVMERGQIEYNTGFDAIPSYGSNTSYDTFKGQFNGYSRSAYLINVYGATSITVKGVQTFTCFSYNSLGQFISSDVTSDGIVNLPQNTTFVRIQIAVGQLDFIEIAADGNSSPLTEEKRVQMRSGEDIIVNEVVKGVEEEKLVFQIDGDIFTTALMYLPPNHMPNGKKVPLILWDSGDSSYKSWQSYHMGSGYERRITGLKYLRDQGFAVVEVYPWGSYNYYYHYDCGGRAAMPLHTHLMTHTKAVEYVCSRYNIDAANVFELSKSGSGKLSLYYAQIKPDFNLRAIYAMAPVFDDFAVGTGNNDFRRAINEDLNLEDLPASERDTDLVSQYPNDTPLQQYLNGVPASLGGSVDSQGNPKGFKYLDYSVPSDNALALKNVADNRKFIKHNASKFARVGVSWTNLVGQTCEDKVDDSMDWAAVVQPIIYGGGANIGGQMAALTFNDCYGRIDLSMIGNEIPLKVIMSTNDEQTPYLSAAEVVKQLRNGGKEATIITLSSQGHSAPDMGTGNNAVASVTTMLGVTYSAVSIGWYIACEDIMKRYLAHTDSEVYDYIYSNE